MISGKKTYLTDWLSQEGKIDWLHWAAVPVALGAGLLLGLLGSFMLVAFAAGCLILSYLFLSDQYALLAVIIIGVGIFVDFFLLVQLPFNVHDLATILALLFLVAAFMAQSSARPWVRVPHLPWWLLLLVLVLPPAIRGGILVNGGKYYVEVFLNALLLYIVGVQVVRDLSHIRRLFSFLSGFATLIAIHSILQAGTGNVLFPIHYWDNYLASVNNFTLAGSREIRAGSFLINPDSDGSFLALLLFLPVSLLLETPSRLLKGLYAAEAVLILLGLFFTYSLIAIGALCLGGVIFIMLVGKGRYRFYLLGGTGALLLVIVVAFPSLARSMLSHGGNAANEFSQRLGIWETALRVIQAHPLIGLGFGFHAYLNGSEPYRVPLQNGQLIHPHNSFLEFAALAGIPVMLVMLIILGKLFLQAFRNHRGGGRSQRILLGGGITALAVITINSLASNSWTLPPLVLVDWLIMGALSSPGLIQPLRSRFLEKRLSDADRKTDEILVTLEGVQN